MRTVSAAVLGLGLVTACSSSTDSTAPPTAADVQAFSTAQCDYFERCLPYELDNFWGTKDVCVAQLSAAVSPSLTLKGTAVTEAEASACRARYAALSCDDPSTPAECLFEGTLAEGSPCATSIQCASANCYFTTSTTGVRSDCGTCKAAMVEGGDCTDADCAEGLTCTSDNKCARGAAVGSACKDAFDCLGNLQCAAGKCAVPFPEGTACNPLDRTAGICNRNVNLYCKPASSAGTTGTCTKIAYAKLGDTCGIDASFQATLCTGSQCDTTSGKCVPYLAEGAACSASSGNCGYGLGCTGGTCQKSDLARCNP